MRRLFTVPGSTGICFQIEGFGGGLIFPLKSQGVNRQRNGPSIEYLARKNRYFARLAVNSVAGASPGPPSIVRVNLISSPEIFPL